MSIRTAAGPGEGARDGTVAGTGHGARDGTGALFGAKLISFFS